MGLKPMRLLNSRWKQARNHPNSPADNDFDRKSLTGTASASKLLLLSGTSVEAGWIGHNMNPRIPKRLGGTEHSVSERFEQAKAALAQADPFYKSESFWKAFEESGVDEFQVAKLEGMVKSYREKDATPQSPASKSNDPIGQLLDKYDWGTIQTVEDLVDEAEALGTAIGNQELLNVVQAFRRFQQEDRALSGRGDWDEAEAILIAGMRRAQSGCSTGLE